MIVVFDTNVVLDLLLDRLPFSEVSEVLFNQIEQGVLPAMLCATTLTTIHYLASKMVGNIAARAHIRDLLSLFEIAPVTRAVLEQALNSPLTDFEDAVLAESAWQAGATVIITRNPKDFMGGSLSVYQPQEWLNVRQING